MKLEGGIWRPAVLGYVALIMFGLKSMLSQAEAATAPAWKWVKQVGANQFPSTLGMSADSSGRLYIHTTLYSGTFAGYKAQSAYYGPLVGAFDPDGSFKFAKDFQAYDSPFRTVQRSGGNIGYQIVYQSSVPNFGGSMVFGSWDSNGSSLWTSTAIPLNLGSLVIALAADSSDGMVLAGAHGKLLIDGNTYASGMNANLHVLSVDAQGSLRWVQRIIVDRDALLTSVCVNKADQSVWAGGYTGSRVTICNPLILTNNYNYQIPFLTRYNANGEIQWIQSPAWPDFWGITALESAADGSVYFLGKSVPTDTSTHCFLGKFNRDGKLLWIKKIGKSFDMTYDKFTEKLRLDAQGNVIVGYNFKDSITIDGATFTSRGELDILIAKFAPNGTNLWVKTAGFLGRDYFRGLVPGLDGTIFVTGYFDGSALFDNLFLEGNTSANIFLGAIEPENENELRILTQPASQSVSVGGTAAFEITVAPATGLEYQWYFQGLAVPGATNRVLSILGITSNDQGSYEVEVKAGPEKLRSRPADLTVKGESGIQVTTFAGGNGPGYVDSSDPKKVQLYRPNGLAYYSQGLFVVADEFNQVLRLIDGAGRADTYAGTSDEGDSDGPARLARFKIPLGVAVTPTLDVFVADYGNHRVRKVAPFALRPVTTVAGSDPGYQDGPSTQALLRGPNDLVADSAGNIYFTEFNNHTVRKLQTDGTVVTVAGNGLRGEQNGLGTKAQFDQPGGITIDSQNNLYVTEYSGLRIRKIDSRGAVTTVAGSGIRGFLDGNSASARFNAPDGITIDPEGNLYVCEGGNHTIRRIASDGTVTTIAGLGQPGFRDGDAKTALFHSPGGLTWHPTGGLIVADTENHALRRIRFANTPSSAATADYVVTLSPTLTIIGKPGSTYRIEATEDAGPDREWFTLERVKLTEGSIMWCDPQAAKRKWRYYRAIAVDDAAKP